MLLTRSLRGRVLHHILADGVLFSNLWVVFLHVAGSKEVGLFRRMSDPPTRNKSRVQRCIVRVENVNSQKQKVEVPEPCVIDRLDVTRDFFFCYSCHGGDRLDFWYKYAK